MSQHFRPTPLENILNPTQEQPTTWRGLPGEPTPLWAILGDEPPYDYVEQQPQVARRDDPPAHMYNMVAYRDDPSGYLQNEPAYRDASPEQGYNFLDYLDPLRRRQSEVVQLADNSPSATPGAGAPTAGLPTASVPNAGPSAPADPIASGESDGEYFMPGGELNWPTNYPLVTGEFGVVDTDHWPNGHTGIDARAPLGSPIYAMDGGEVISTTPSPGGANQIIVQHPDGKIGGYAHLDPTVGIGDQLLPGQVIGHSDGSGNVKPHAHISLRPGKDKARIDPYLFLPQVPIKKRH